MNKAIIIVIVLLVLAALVGAVYYYQNYYKTEEKQNGFTPTVLTTPKVGVGSVASEEGIKVGGDINPVKNMPSTNPLEGANPFGGGSSNPFEE